MGWRLSYSYSQFQADQPVNCYFTLDIFYLRDAEAATCKTIMSAMFRGTHGKRIAMLVVHFRDLQKHI